MVHIPSINKGGKKKKKKHFFWNIFLKIHFRWGIVAWHVPLISELGRQRKAGP
jgi:hypothetical protein